MTWASIDPKRKKMLIGSGGLAVLIIGAWWWLHDPFHLIGNHVVSDQTIYYQVTKPLFNTPRRQRTLFLKGISMEDLLAHTQKQYPVKDGWVYSTNGMPQGFSATRDAPGDQLPERIGATNNRDGNLQLFEVRVMSAMETQLVKRTQGSDAFVLYPGAPRPRPNMGSLDRTRFPIVAN